VTDSAPQIGFYKGFSKGVEYKAYCQLKNILFGIKDQAGSVTSGLQQRPSVKDARCKRGFLNIESILKSIERKNSCDGAFFFAGIRTRIIS